METASDPAAIDYVGPRPWPAFDTPNILWFFGAFTATAACDTVLTRVHPGARGTWLLLASLAFLIAFAAISAGFLRTGWWIPGGALAAMAVTFVVPVAIAFEQLIGVSQPAVGPGPLEEFDGSIFAVVVALALAGVAAFWLVRFHFILALVAVATFFAAQLLVPALVDLPGPGTFATAFVVVGGILVVAGLVFDAVADRRSAFWWHLVGLVTLSIGLGYHAFRNATWGWVIIFVFGVTVILLATSLLRGTWAVFGVAGFYAPIAHYLNAWFGDLGTAFALAAVGLGLIALGIAARSYGGAWPTVPLGFGRRESG